MGTKQRRLSPTEKNEIRQLYLTGKSPEDIVSKFGCSKSNFWLVVKGLQAEAQQQAFDTMVSKIKVLNPEHLGWVAGIIDGEGWIGLGWKKNYIHPRVSVASTTPSMQNRLYELCGGNIYTAPRDENERDLYVWNLQSLKETGAFLRVIEPHLVVKQHISKVVRELCERRMTTRWSPYTQKDYDAVDIVKEFNSRGRCPSQEDSSL